MLPIFASWQVDATTRAVRCVFSGEVFTYIPPFAWTVFSREHTWCHSWMPTYPSESGNEYSDQHHLFPTNQNNANGVRSNHPLAKVVNVTSSYLECKYGTDSNGNYVFEPRMSIKGMPPEHCFIWLSNMMVSVAMTGLSAPFPADWSVSLGETFQDVNLLLQWHRQDPPDKWEVDRNDYVQSISRTETLLWTILNMPVTSISGIYLN